MKKSLLLLLLFIFTISLYAQRDTLSLSPDTPKKDIYRDASNIRISIYPVPVRDNSLTIKCDRDISSVRITNIIGQDIFRVQYKNPLSITKILLDNPKRGMYLVSINFSDGARVVKKIMIEELE